MPGTRGRNIVQRWCLILSLALVGVLAVGPVVFLLTGSLMGTQEIRYCLGAVVGSREGYALWHWIPLYPTLKNFVELCLDSPEFFQMFWNTAKITGGILAGQLLFGVPAAWGLARYTFPGQRLVYLCYLVLMLMPFQVTMLSEYLVLRELGLLDTFAAVIWPGIFSAFPAFIMCRFFGGIPEVLLEAARVDGAGEAALFFFIGIPVGSSGILSALMLQFIECWSMIEQPLTFLDTKSLWPLTLYLPQISMKDAGFALCASFVTVLPAVLVFLCGQDYLEQGIASTAIKE